MARQGDRAGEGRAVSWPQPSQRHQVVAGLRSDRGQRRAASCVVDVANRLLPDSTRWEFELTPAEAGTRLTERMQILQIFGLYDRLFAAMLPQHRDRTADLEGDLGRIKTRLEAGADTTV